MKKRAGDEAPTRCPISIHHILLAVKPHIRGVAVEQDLPLLCRPGVRMEPTKTEASDPTSGMVK
jgi:hypothetical protein